MKIELNFDFDVSMFRQPAKITSKSQIKKIKTTDSARRAGGCVDNNDGLTTDRFFKKT